MIGTTLRMSILSKLTAPISSSSRIFRIEKFGIGSKIVRLAHCSCHQLTVVTNGEPHKISVCHCRACQHRTGSAFGVAVFYAADQIRASGKHQTYIRPGDSGKRLEFRFCPTCGSTVYWIPEFRPNLVAIALGCFEDPDAMEPTQSVYEATRHAWVSLSFRDSG